MKTWYRFHRRMETMFNHLPLFLVWTVTFSSVEEFIARQRCNSGKEQISKGFKYYTEGYVHSIKLYPDDAGCLMKGKCFRSRRRNKSPHVVEVSQYAGDTRVPWNTLVYTYSKLSNEYRFFTSNINNQVYMDDGNILHSKCSCTIGLSGFCGHVIGLLYQVAHYKSLGLSAVPKDVAKTSLPQTWHTPREEKIRGSKVDNITVQGYDRENPQKATKGINSTLYNPIPDNTIFDINALIDEVSRYDMDIRFTSVVDKNSCSGEKVQTVFGKFVKGSVLSYQQRMPCEFIMNLMDVDEFPDLPIRNLMENTVSFVLSENQTKQHDALKVSVQESTDIENATRLQSSDPKWHYARQNKITASIAGDIVKRRKDGDKLAERLRSKPHMVTAAMKHGIQSEDMAANSYCKLLDNNINVYPSGLVVSPFCHWFAATPDRKVYNPNRDPPCRLLEIKCPRTKYGETFISCNC